MIDKQSEGESLKQNNNFKNIQQQTQEVICRIFFVRHGVSKEEAKIGKKTAQLPSTELSITWAKEMFNVANTLIDIWCTPENTLILYSEWEGGNYPMKRVMKSQQILQRKKTGKFDTHKLLDTTEKKIDPITNNIVNKNSHLYDVGKQFLNAVELMENEILQAFTMTSEWQIQKVEGEKQYDFAKYKNIVLLGHKSNELIPQIATERPDAVTVGKSTINTGEIYEFDINAEWYYTNYKKNKDILHFTTGNYKEVIEILSQEPWLQESIVRFKNKEIDLRKLQNEINAYFQQHPEFYEKYLTSKNESLMVFCLSNVIQWEKCYIIQKSIEQNREQYTVQEKNNIFDIVKWKIQVLEVFLKNFFKEKNKTNEYNILKSYILEELIKLWDDFVLLMNYFENINPLIQETKERSLDSRVKKWKDINPKFNFDNQEYKNDPLNILLSEKKITLIEAIGWSWKSFLLCTMNEKLKAKKFTHWKIFFHPIYISLWWIEEISELKNSIDKICVNYNQNNFVYFLDSLDEAIFSDKKEKLKEFYKYIESIPGKVIISSRSGYIKDNIDNIDNIEKIQLKEMENIDSFVKDYFWKDVEAKKRNKFKQLKEKKRVEGIVKNPLMLLIVCELIDGNENIEINDICDLYEKIIEKRLKQEHNKDGIRKIKWECNLKEIVDVNKKKLEKMAYDSYFNKTKMTKEYLSKECGVVELNDIEALSLLFRKNNDWEFNFIHETIREHLVMMYCKNNIDKILKINVPKIILPLAKITVYLAYDVSDKAAESLQISMLGYKNIVRLLGAKLWYKDLICMLIKKWINVNFRDYENWMTALMYAAKSSNIDIVEVLIKNKADIDKKDYAWKTALYYAIESENFDMVIFLLNKWARIDIKDSWGQTVLYYAAKCKKTVIMQVLLDKWVDVNAKNIRNENVLTSAVKMQNKEMINILLDYKAKINQKIGLYETVLYWAVASRNGEIVELLLNKWAEINKIDREIKILAKEFNIKNLPIPNAWKKTPVQSVLIKAINDNNKEMVELLLDRWADIDVWDDITEDHVLYCAIKQKNKEMIKLLLDRWVKIDISNMMTSAYSHDEEIIEMLLSKWMEVYNIEDIQSLLDYVTFNINNQEIIKIIRDKLIEMKKFSKNEKKNRTKKFILNVIKKILK